MDADKAIKAWAAKKIGVHPDTVVRVDFGTKQMGYCATCEYTVTGVEVSYKKKGNNHVASDFISLEYQSFADVLEDILYEGREL